jgi:hypothetical protein
MDINETGFEDVIWIKLAQDIVQWRILVYTVMSI